MKKNHKYKGIVYVVILIILVAVGLYFKDRHSATPAALPETPSTETPKPLPEISISSKNIKEENFTGKVPVIGGDSLLAVQSQAYIDQTIADFRKQANTDVPPMRKEFGADSPTAQYEIDIDAKYSKSEKTASIVMLVYTYTGGAHGNSLYKVITVSTPKEKFLALSDVIKQNKQNAFTEFTEFVKKELTAWQPEGTDASPVFPEDVQALTFGSFQNWSMDDKNLTLYFSQYEIGPGALGPVAFPLPLQKIKDFLQ